MPDLLALHKMLKTATTPEEVFGRLPDDPANAHVHLKKSFRAMALIAHPDRSPTEPALAAITFRLLEEWLHRAQARVDAGNYGKTSPPADPVPITTRRGTFLVHEPLLSGDYFTLYRCTRADRKTALVIKIVHEPRDNDLLEHEADSLRILARLETHARRYFPKMVDSFLSTDGATQRRALILGSTRPIVRLTDIRAAYPSGLDPRDAAWIFNRILEALWFTHQAGLVHGAVVPTNLWVDVENHGLLLTEWAFAAASGVPMAAISDGYATWYPAEVLNRTPASPSSDIAMAVRCLVYLLGGDPVAGTIPPTVPKVLQRFVKGCLGRKLALSPSDAGALREEFDGCLTQLYGKRAFRPLAMPV